MFVSNQSAKLKIFNTSSNKNLLIQGINNLSNRIQKEYSLNETNSINSNRSQEDFIILTLENEALDHIENLILDVLDSILLASSSLNDPSPENACAFVMSNSGGNLTKTVLYPILNINQAEIIVKKALPLIYSEEACKKALNVVEKSKNILTSSKRNRILKTFNVNPSSSFSLLTSATSSSNDSNNNSTHTFSFPLEQIHSILSVTYQTSKLDIYVTLFLVAILEHITKDILRFSSNYSRELNKYSISKGDVITAIQGDKDKLNALFYSSSSSLSSINSSFNYLINSSLLNDYFDDDFDDYELEYELGRFTLDRAGHDFLPRTDDNDHSSITTAHNLPILSNITETNLTTAQNADECMSDSSTICAESVTYENLNSRYNSKVKELVSEQQQHLIDLNILRRIFMYLFKKHDSNNQLDESIENIFGNINDVYECALKLADLLDENQQQQQQQQEQNASSQTNLNQPLVIGELFWELAEGKEFDVYSNYAFYVTKLETIKSSLHTILNDQNVYKSLQQSGQGLVEISKYLLPQLLFGPVHHFIYFFETIEYLLQISFDEEDRSYLKSTRDTLLDVKHEIKKLNFFSSKQRPIETSFRLFQPHIFQVGANSNKNKSMSSSVFSVGEVSNASTVTNIKVPALTYNICILTEHKWKEIEQNVDSLKIPSHIYESCQPQILVGSLNQAKNSNNFMSGSNIRYAYLYEGSMQVCKTTQQIQSNQINNLKVGQTKLKVSKRYIYLFDGLLILVKKQQTNMLLNTNLSSNTKSYRFKDAIQLDKCILKDREDELCFELQISSQNQSDMDTTLNQSQFDQSQDQIYILFIADSANEKYHWMSMLCYSKYKLNIDRLHQKMNEEHNRNNPLPIPPKDYVLFDQPDTPETIIFEQMNKNLEGANQSINSEVFVIKSATLVKLVEHLTHHKLIYPKFTPTFLMFFREFTNPKELLSLLSKRFDVPELDLDSITNSTLTHRELLKRYKKEYQEPIRLKIIILLKQWIQGYYNDDFANNDELIENLNILIKKIGKTSKKFENAFNALNQLLQKKSNMYDEQKLLKQQQQQQNQQKSTNDILLNLQIQSNTDDSPVDYYNLKNIFRKKISTSLSSNSSLSNHSSRSSSTSTNDDSSNDQDFNDFLYPPIETYLETTLKIYDILTIHPLEFARQVTLMQEEIFKAIKPNELITIGWNKPDKKYIISPNVSKLSTLSNKFIYWYAKCIVDTKNLEERIAVVHRLLDIAHYFYQMNNFSGLREIYAALETSSTVRLKVTREKSGLEEHKMYVLFKQLFDDHDKGYLDRLKKCSPPCIPFIGIHLSIIYKRHEYNKLVHPNDQFSSTQQQQQQQPSNLINFSKYRSLIEFINDLLQYQTVSYKFRINERIRSYLLEDIENYFESAKNSPETEDEFSHRAGPLNIAQIVEARLFNQSKLIEPDPDTGMSAKFPRIRNYNLKSPPLINHSNNNKLNQSKLNDTHRSHSATRVDKQNTSSSSKQLHTPNLSKNSTNLFDKLATTNTKLTTKTINNSQTSFNLANQKEDTNNKIVYKRSNSTTQSQFKSDLTDSVLLSGINTSVTNISGSSSSSSPQQRDLQQTSNSASYESALNYAMNNSQKLSISSADSSAPNSPPPNYEEVFDTTSIVNGSIFPLLSNNGVFQQQDKCFDNRTYYQKNLTLNNRSDLSQNSSFNLKSDSKSSLGRTSSASSFSNSLNQVSVFSFPDLNEIDNCINNSVEQNSPLPIINPRHLNFNFNSNSQSSYGPGHRPPTPPTQPPAINRSTKPNNLNKSVSMPPAAAAAPVTVSNSFDPTTPPPVPQRPLKK